MKDEVWNNWNTRQVSEDDDNRLRVLVSTDAKERASYKAWLCDRIKSKTIYGVFPDWSLAVAHSLPDPEAQPFLLVTMMHIGTLEFLRAYRAPQGKVWVVLPGGHAAPILISRGETVTWEDPVLGKMSFRFSPVVLDTKTILHWAQEDLDDLAEDDPRLLPLARGAATLLKKTSHPIQRILEHVAQVTGDPELKATLSSFPPLPELHSLLRGLST